MEPEEKAVGLLPWVEGVEEEEGGRTGKRVGEGGVEIFVGGGGGEGAGCQEEVTEIGVLGVGMAGVTVGKEDGGFGFGGIGPGGVRIGGSEKKG